ncbi:hypothetical protein NDU88_003778 [Pleurodeles waltl]|uniref:Uncharacterized protein n=1 Tax=Pleurodeles waltl TaxID=8319 RepID=A0AAV7MS44_PLEWA|nr:hypothetical protein NDU88_003778 [Pleurodeles waltl]
MQRRLTLVFIVDESARHSLALISPYTRPLEISVSTFTEFTVFLCLWPDGPRTRLGNKYLPATLERWSAWGEAATVTGSGLPRTGSASERARGHNGAFHEKDLAISFRKFALREFAPLCSIDGGESQGACDSDAGDHMLSQRGTA